MNSPPSSDGVVKQDRLDFYEEVHAHEMLLRDRPRVEAYYDAIMNNKRLFENKVVLDVGAGTGVLSMFAAKAGAKRVYAVDACKTICYLAEELIKCNRLHEKIQVINKRVEDIDQFDEKIDIIISDWMGFYLFHESMLESVIYARDTFLCLPSPNDDHTPDQNESIMIFPSHAYLYCAPFVDQNVRIELNSMWKNYFDLNMSPLLPHIKNSRLSECLIETIEPSQLVHEAQLIQSIDLRTVRLDDLRKLRSICEFDIDNPCVISGLCFWFDCYFSSNNNSSILRSTRLTTSPYSARTRWKQTLLFLPEDIYPLKGDTVPVHIKLKQSPANHRHYQLSIVLKKIKERTGPSTGWEDDASNHESAHRRRQRRRSSTISSGKRTLPPNKFNGSSSDSSTASNSDDDVTANEHPIPCSCERDRCKLVKTIIEQYTEENIV